MSTSLKSRKTQYIVPCFMQVVLQPFLVQAHQVQAADCAHKRVAAIWTIDKPQTDKPPLLCVCVLLVSGSIWVRVVAIAVAR